MLVENTNSPTTTTNSGSIKAGQLVRYDKDANDLSPNSCFQKQKLAVPSSLSSIFHDFFYAYAVLQTLQQPDTRFQLTHCTTILLGKSAKHVSEGHVLQDYEKKMPSFA